jgi:arylsulfatase A-like enzyme
LSDLYIKNHKNNMKVNYILLISFIGMINSVIPLFANDDKTNSKPNIILILVDDMGYADVSCYGDGKEVNTPNIDKISHAGIRFTNGYVSGLQCAPTRAGLLSGKYQQRFGFYYNRDVFKEVFLPQVTIPQALKKSGYRTGMIGKWHLGRYKEEERPYNRGFDEFYGFLQGMRGYMQPQPNSPLMRNEKPVGEKFGYLTDFLNREAVSFVNKHSGKSPFFLYVAYNAPHYPLEAKEEHLKKFNTGNPARDKQLAMMASVDEGIGQMIDALKQKGVYDNTLIFFLNDNGGETKRGADNGKLREGKNSVYEGGPRVPFMVSWPNKIKPGQVSSIPVLSLDIFATAVDVAGGTMPKDSIYDSKSMIPLFTGKVKESNHPTMYWQQRRDDWAVRHKNWKLVKPKKGELELYNLETDLSETTDLAAKHPEILEKLKTLYADWHKQMKGFPITKNKKKKH